MFSVAVVEPDRVEIVEIQDPQPGPYEAVIKNEVSDAVFAPQDTKLTSFDQFRTKPLDAVIDAVGSQAVINAGLALIKTAGSIPLTGLQKGARRCAGQCIPHRSRHHPVQWTNGLASSF